MPIWNMGMIVYDAIQDTAFWLHMQNALREVVFLSWPGRVAAWWSMFPWSKWSMKKPFASIRR